MEANDRINRIEKGLANHDEALFGMWISASKRDMGVVEKTNSLMLRLTKLETMLKVLGGLVFVNALSSLGVPTQSLVPLVLRSLLHLLGN
jgi:hypothetical protein